MYGVRFHAARVGALASGAKSFGIAVVVVVDGGRREALKCPTPFAFGIAQTPLCE